MKNKYKNQAIAVCVCNSRGTGLPVLMQWFPKELRWACIHGKDAQEDEQIINDFLKRKQEGK